MVSSPTSFTTSVSLLPTVVQSSAEMGHEVVAVTDSWTDVQQQNPCTPSVTQGFAEHTCLPTDGENWEDKDFANPH